MIRELVMMMLIAPNCHAYNGEKEIGEVKVEFGGRREMPTTGEWCNSVRNMLHYV